MGYDGTLLFDTDIDRKGFESGVTSLAAAAKNGLAKIGVALSGAAIIRELYQVGKAAVDTASDLTEVQNVVDVTFAKNAGTINNWAKSSMAAYGLSELSAKQYTGTIGAMFKSMKLGDADVLRMSQGIAALSGDFASFFNITSDEAFSVLRSAVSGETEAIKRFGVNMQTANLEAFALSQGIKKSYDEMTQAEKATLRYDYIMSAMADTQGDYARTSDQLANSQRTMNLEFESLSATVAKKALPTITSAVRGLGSLAKDLRVSFEADGINGMMDVIEQRIPVGVALFKGLAAAIAAMIVLKTIQGAMLGYAAVQASVNALLVAGTATEWAEIGALSVKQIIVAGLSGQMGFLTMAQQAFNAAVAANPIMTFVVVLGLLVGAASLVTSTLKRTNPELFAASNAASAAAQATKTLLSQMEQSKGQYDETTGRIDKQARSMEALVTKLDAMSAAYTGSTAEQAKMDAMVAELNSSFAGLDLSYDRNTGKLNKNAEAVRQYANAQISAARVTAAAERWTQILQEQADAEYTLWQARKTFYSMGEGSGATNADRLKANKAVRDASTAYDAATKSVENYDEYLKETGIDLNDYVASTDDAAAATEGLGDAEERVVIAGYDVTDMLKAHGITAQEAADRLAEYTDVALGMFDKIETKPKKTTKQMLKTWKENIEALGQWTENIKFLGDKLPATLLEALVAKGPKEMAGALNALAKSTPAQFAEIQQLFSEGGSAAAEAWLASLGIGLSETPTVTIPTVTPDGSPAPTSGATTTPEATNPIKPLTEAVTADTSLSEALTATITAAMMAADTAITTHDFTVTVAAAATSIEAPFAALPDKLFLHGVNTGDGFIRGLRSKIKDAVSAALAMANAVAFTFKVKLEINSPSRLSSWFADMFVEGFAGTLRKGIDRTRQAASALLGGAVETFKQQSETPFPSSVGDGVEKVINAAVGVKQVTFGASASDADLRPKQSVTHIEHQHNGIESLDQTYEVPVEDPITFGRRVRKDITEVVAYVRG